MNADAWAQTVAVALEGVVITAEPADTAYTTEFSAAALAALAEEHPELDLVGESYEPVTVELREGGE
jgi:hypothetical protein